MGKISIVLLVTWFQPGQPPASYQVEFNSEDACAAAAKSVYAKAERIRQKLHEDARTAAARMASKPVQDALANTWISDLQKRDLVNSVQAPIRASENAPHVAAACIAK